MVLKKKIFFLRLMIFVLIFPLLVFAQGGIQIENPLEWESIEELIDRITDVVFYLVLVAVPVAVLIGAIYILISAGDTEKIKIGKNTIIYSLVGLVIVFLAKGIIALVRYVLGIGD